ncbi:tetratricopeptide repeat protein [Pirellulaceae bacterium SH467]
MKQNGTPGRDSMGSWKSELAGIRWPQLTACALIASLLLLGIYVLLNPLEDDPELMERLLREQRGASRGSEMAKGGIGSVLDGADPLGSLEPTLVFAGVEGRLGAAELQAYLAEVAETLTTEMASDSAALHIAAMIYAELRQTQTAEGLWRQCLEMSAEEMGPVVGLSGLLVDQGKTEEAIEILERARTSEKSTAEYFQKLADAYTKIGNLDSAEEIAKLGVRKFPNVAALWYELGVIESQLRKNGQAESSLRRAVDLGDRSRGTVNALVTILNRVGKTEEAQDLAKSVLPVEAEKPESNDVPEGSEKQASDATFSESYAEVLRNLAVPLLRNASSVAAANKKLEHAEKWLLQALAEEPTNGEIYMDLSSILRTDRKWGDAVVLHQKLLDIQPTNILNYMNLASVATQAQRPELAEQVLADATKRFPDVAYLYGERAKLALVRGNTTLFEQLATKAYDLEPMNVEWTLMLAVAARQSGNSEEMKKLIQRAHDLAPGDPRVPDPNNLGAP